MNHIYKATAHEKDMMRTKRYLMNNLAIFSIMFAFLIILSSTASANLLDGLTTYYSFDEGSGSTTRDLTSSLNNGTLYNSPTWMTGKRGSALSFDGINDYVVVGNGGSTNFAWNFSFGYWFNNTGQLAYYAVARDSGQPDNNVKFRTGTASSGSWASFCSGNYLQCIDVIGPTFTADNQWHHVLFTTNATHVTMYLDGVWTNATANPPGFALTTTDTRIGSRTSGDFFDGDIDEIGFWNRTLSSAEALQLYNQVTPYYPNATWDTTLNRNLKYYWNFDQSGNKTDLIQNNTINTFGSSLYNSSGKRGGAWQGNGAGFGNVSMNLVGNMTISMWMRNYDQWNDGNGLSNWFEGINTVSQLNLQSSNCPQTGPAVTGYFGDRGGYSHCKGTPEISYNSNGWFNGEWFHVVITLEDGVETRFYLNGVENWTEIDSGFTPTNNNLTGVWAMGTTEQASAYTLNSNNYMDEFAVWNRVLSASEVSKLYNNGNGLTYSASSPSNGSTVSSPVNITFGVSDPNGISNVTINVTKVVSSSPAYNCTQGSPTASNSCGGSGNILDPYAGSSPFTPSGQLYDGNWGTYSTCSNPGNGCYVGFNYTKPANATGAYINTKFGDGNHTLQVPDTCFNYYQNNLIILLNGGFGTKVACINSTNIYSDYTMYLTGSQSNWYETEIIWVVSPTPSGAYSNQTTINIGGATSALIGIPFYLTNGVYNWFITVVNNLNQASTSQTQQFTVGSSNWWNSSWNYRYLANFSNLDYNQPYPNIVLNNIIFSSGTPSNELRLICDSAEIPVTIESSTSNSAIVTITTNNSWSSCYWYTGNSNPSSPTYSYRGGEFFLTNYTKFLTRLDNGNVTDIANNNPGTITNAVNSSTSSCRFGTCYYFGGTNSRISYNPNNTYVSMLQGDDNFCISGWFNNTDTNVDGRWISNDDSATGNQNWFIRTNPESYNGVMRFQTQDSGYLSVDSPTSYISYNKWEYYSICQNDTARSFWRNGTLISSGSRTTIGEGNWHMNIGDTYDNQDPFTGHIDELGVFKGYYPGTMNKQASMSLGSVETLSESNWWNNNWNARKRINITTSESTLRNNVSVLITIPYDSDMKSNFGDLRFVDANNNELGYWFYNNTYSASSQVRVYVKMNTAINSSTPTYIYAYYGNPSVNTTSNISNAFLFGDDFYSIDWNSKWQTNNQAKYVANNSGTGTMIAISTASSNLINTNRSFNDYISEWRISTNVVPQGGSYVLDMPTPRVWADSSNVEIDFAYLSIWRANINPLTISELNNVGVAVANKYYILKTIVPNTGNATVNGTHENGTVEISLTGPPVYRTLYPSFLQYDNGAPVVNANSSIDWMFVRQYVSVEPTATLGAEEGGTSINPYTGVVAHYKLDETSGVVRDTTGVYNGTNNGATTNVAGKINTSYQFTTNQYVNTSLSLAPVSKSVSIWLNWDGTNNEYGWAWSAGDYTNGSNPPGRPFGLFHDNSVTSNKLIFYGYNLDDFYLDNAGALTANTWYHVVITYNGSTVKAYVNGNMTDTAARNLETTPEKFSIGYRRDSPANSYWRGKLDEAAVWNRELTSDEVSALYNNGSGLTYNLPVTPPPVVDYTWPTNLNTNLVQYYKFDDSTGVESVYGIKNLTLSSSKVSDSALINKSYNYTTESVNTRYNLNRGANPTNFTINLWYQYNAGPGDYTYLMTNSPDNTLAGDGRFGMMQIETWGTIQIFANAPTGTPVNGYGVNVYPNTWTMLTLRGNSTSVSVLQDGVLKATWNTTFVANDANLTLFSDTSGNNQGKGKIDELGIWDRYLTDSEIVQLYNSGSGISYQAPAPTPVNYTWPSNLNTGLMVYLPFNESSGTVATSPLYPSRNATLYNTPSFVSGKVGNALFVNASSSQYGVVQNFGMNSTSNMNRTMSIWVYPLVNNTNVYVDSGTEIVAAQAMGIGRNYYGSDTKFWGHGQGGPNDPLDPAESPNNQWYHLVLMDEGSVRKLYVNGVNVANASAVTTIGNNVLSIGQGAGLGGWGLSTAYLDELAVWNRSLTNSEVAQLYNGGNGVTYQAPAITTYNWTSNLHTGLISYWPMNDSSGTVVRDVYGTNNGTLAGTPQWTTGKVNGALNLTIAGNNWIDINKNAGLQPQELSISMWFRTTTANGAHLFRNRYSSYDFTTISSKLVMTHYFASGQNIYLQSSSNVDDGNWHYATFTYNGTEGKLYLDGTLVANATSASYGTYYNDDGYGNITIGKDGGVGGADMDGAVDEVGYWSRSLTQSEVVQLYNNGNGIAYQTPAVNTSWNSLLTPGLTAYYKFDETAGIIAEDSVNNYDLASSAYPNYAGKINTAFRMNTANDTRLNYTGIGTQFGGTGKFTFSEWVYLPTTTSQSHQYIFQLGTSVDPSRALRRAYDAGNVLVYRAQANECSSATALPLDQWIHLVTVYNGTHANIYLNGNSTPYITCADANSIAANPNLAIGWPYLVGYGFDGYVDEVGLWNKTLNTTEVSLLYNSGYGITYQAPPQNTWNSSLNTNLEAYYKLDEGTGTVIDVVNGYNGVNAGAVNTTGKINSAYTFDGTDRINISHNFDIQNSITLTAWVYPTTQIDAGVISKRSGVGTDNWQLYYEGSTSQWEFFIWNSSTQNKLEYDHPLNLNQWEFLSVTYNGSLMSLYINGQLVQTKNATGLINSNNLQTTIGNDWYTAFWNGKIDEVGIWSRSLSASEISQLYNSGSGLPFNGTTASQWPSYLNDQLTLYYNMNSTAENVNGIYNMTTRTGTLNFTTSGAKVGKSAIFDRTQSADIADGTPLIEFSNAQPTTMNFWFKSDLSGTNNFMLEKYDTGGVGWYVEVTNAGMMEWAYFHQGAGAAGDCGWPASSVTANTWTMATIVRNGSQSWTYKNGQYMTTCNGTMAASTRNLTIGKNIYGDGSDDLRGGVDELAFWARPLNASEVLTLYNSGTGRTYEPSAGAGSGSITAPADQSLIKVNSTLVTFYGVGTVNATVNVYDSSSSLVASNFSTSATFSTNFTSLADGKYTVTATYCSALACATTSPTTFVIYTQAENPIFTPSNNNYVSGSRVASSSIPFSVLVSGSNRTVFSLYNERDRTYEFTNSYEGWQCYTGSCILGSDKIRVSAIVNGTSSTLNKSINLTNVRAINIDYENGTFTQPGCWVEIDGNPIASIGQTGYNRSVYIETLGYNGVHNVAISCGSGFDWCGNSEAYINRISLFYGNNSILYNKIVNNPSSYNVVVTSGLGSIVNASRFYDDDYSTSENFNRTSTSGYTNETWNVSSVSGDLYYRKKADRPMYNGTITVYNYLSSSYETMYSTTVGYDSLATGGYVHIFRIPNNSTYVNNGLLKVQNSITRGGILFNVCGPGSYNNIIYYESDVGNSTFPTAAYREETFNSVYYNDTLSVNWTGLADGTYWYLATMYGSLNASNLYNVTLDNTYPTVQLLTPANGSSLTPPITFTANINDTETGNLANATLSIYNMSGSIINQTIYDLSAYAQYDLSQQVTLSQGQYYWNVQATDQANLQNISSNYTFTVVGVPPIVTIISPVTWALSSWNYRKPIYVQGGSATLTDFTVYVNISYSSNMQSDFEDLRFYSSCSAGATQLKYEFDNVVNSSSAGVWIKVPTLTTGTNTLCMYYGNPSATNGEDPANAWDSNYIVVMHFSEGSGSNLTNSKDGTNFLQLTGSPNWITGKLGYAINLSTGKYARSSGQLYNIPDNWTTEISSYAFGTSGTPRVFFSKLYDRPGLRYGFSTGQGDSGGSYANCFFGNNVWNSQQRVTDSVGQWNVDHCYSTNGVVDGTFGFRNLVGGGSRTGSGGSGGSVYQTGDWALSYFDGTQYWGDAAYDEVRMSSGIRSSDWLNRTYQDFVANSSMFSFGSEELTNSSIIYTNQTVTNFTINATDPDGLANATLTITNTTGIVNQTTISLSSVISAIVSIPVALVDGIYNWFWTVVDVNNNQVVVNQTSSGDNSTYTAPLVVDTVNPGIQFISPTYDNGANVSASSFPVTVRVNDTNKNSLTINLFNSNLALINSTTFAINNLTYSQTSSLADTLGSSTNNPPPVGTNAIGAYGWSAFKFTATNNYVLNTVQIYVAEYASLTGVPVTVGIYPANSTGGISDFTLIGSNSTANSGTFSVGYHNFTFPNNNTLIEAGRSYWIVFFASNSPNYIRVGSSANTGDCSGSGLGRATPVSSPITALSSATCFGGFNANDFNIQLYGNVGNGVYSQTFSVPNGRYYYNATTTDYAGNSNSTETRSIMIDTNNPVITLVNPSTTSTTYTTSPNYNFTFNLRDPSCNSYSSLLSSGLVGMWEFEEGAGITAYDATGKSNGTLMQTSGISYTNDSKVGRYSIYIDGTNGYVDVPYQSEYNSQNLTVCTWYKYNGTQASPYTRIIDRGNYGIVPDGWSFTGDDGLGPSGTGGLSGYYGNGAIYSYANNKTMYADNNWHYGCFVYNYSTTATYKDGVRLGIDISVNNAVNMVNTKNIAFGTQIDDTTPGKSIRLKGYLDNVRVYNRALTDSEINQLYTAEINGSCTADGSGLNNATLSVGGTNYTTSYSNTFSTTYSNLVSLSDNTYPWTMTARDYANNFNSESGTIIVDTTVPTIDYVSPTLPSGSNLSSALIPITVNITENNPDTITFRVWNNTWSDSQVISSNYAKKKLVSNITSYYAVITVPYDSDMQTDFDDVKWTDSSNRELGFTRLSYTPGVSAVFRVNTGGASSLYMYYSNPTASSNSNVETMFGADVKAYWTFDEANGTMLVDYSGNGEDFENKGSTPYVPGKIGSAASLTSPTQFFQKNVSTGLVFSYGNWSVSGWIKTTDTNAEWIINRQDGTGSGYATLALPIGNNNGGGAGKFGFYNSGVMADFTTVSVATGNWTHVTAVKQGTNMTFYLNGVFDKTTAISNNEFGNTAWDWQIGGYDNSVGSLNGQLDDMVFFNQALTPTQVAQIYNTSDSNAVFGSEENNTAFVGSTFTVSTTFNISAQGRYYYNVSVTDDVNNTNTTATRNIMLDTQVPFEFGTSEVYQETANSIFGANNVEYVYVNYTKPLGFISAKWQIGYVRNSPADLIMSNNTLPAWCLSQNPTSINLRFTFHDGSTKRVYGDCYNGTGYQNIVSLSYSAGGWGSGSVDSYTDTIDGSYSSVSCWDPGYGGANKWRYCSAGADYGFADEAIYWTVSSRLPLNNTYTNQSTQNFTISLGDNSTGSGLNNATLTITNNNNGSILTFFQQFTGQFTAILGIPVTLADGLYTWYYSAFDFASNLFTSPFNTLTVDTITPTGQILFPTNTTYTTPITNVTLRLSNIIVETYQENSTSYTCNAGSWTGNAGIGCPKAFDGYWLTSSLYAMRTSGTYSAENVSYNKYPDSIGAKWQVMYSLDIPTTVNLTIPQDCWDAYSNKIDLRIVSQVGTPSNSSYFCWNGSWKHLHDNPHNLNAGSNAYIIEEAIIWQAYQSGENISVDFSTDGNTWTNKGSATSSTYTFAQTSVEGIQTWYVKTTDLSGNSNTSSVTFFVDSIAPTIQFNSGTDTSLSYVNRSYINYNITVNDTNTMLVLVNLYNNAGTLVAQRNHTGSGLYTFNNSFTVANGVYNLNATVYDVLLNNATTGRTNITVDTVTPTATYVAPTLAPNGVYKQNAVWVNVSASDTNLQTINITLRGTGGYYNSQVYTATTSSASFFYNWTSLAEGTYNYTGVVTDKAGNVYTMATQVVDVDLTPPTASYVFPTPNDGGSVGIAYIPVNVTASDYNLQSITIRMSSGGSPVVVTSATSPFYYEFVVADGNWMFNVTATDVAGNFINLANRNVYKEYNGENVTICRNLFQAGTYSLLNDITDNSIPSGSACFRITADNVNLNCNGHTITTSASGVSSTRPGFTVTNCTFDTGEDGVKALAGSSGSVNNVEVLGGDAGIRATSASVTVNNLMVDGSTYGLYGDIATFNVNGFSADNVDTVIRLEDSNGSTISNVQFLSSAAMDDLIYLLNSNGNTFTTMEALGASDTANNGLVRLDGSSNNRFTGFNVTTSESTFVDLQDSSTNNTFHDSYYQGSEDVDATSQMFRTWTYRAVVRDRVGDPIGGSTVRVRDQQNNTYTFNTNDDGTTVGQVTQYDITNGTTNLRTPQDSDAQFRDVNSNQITDNINDVTEQEFTLDNEVKSTLLSRTVARILMVIMFLIGLAASTGYFIYKMRYGESVADTWRYFIMMLIWNTIFIILFIVLSGFVMDFFYPNVPSG